MKNQKKKPQIIKSSFLLSAFLVHGFAGMIPTSGFAREMTQYPNIKLQTLDKATARTMTFDAKVGNTLKFGRIYMKVLSCQKSAPTDQPESAAFIQIWEIDQEQKPQWVYSGWMFASSPALSAMDHPLYDVWVVDCVPDETMQQEPVENKTDPAQPATPAAVTPAEDIPEETVD